MHRDARKAAPAGQVGDVRVREEAAGVEQDAAAVRELGARVAVAQVHQPLPRGPVPRGPHHLGAQRRAARDVELLGDALAVGPDLAAGRIRNRPRPVLGERERVQGRGHVAGASCRPVSPLARQPASPPARQPVLRHRWAMQCAMETCRDRN